MDWTYFYELKTDNLLQLAIGLLVVFVTVTAIVRITGLRALSKMNSYDFIGTLVIASLIPAVVIPSDISLAEGVLGLAWWQIMQKLTARLTYRSETAEMAINQNPVLLLRNGEILHDKLQQVAVTESNLMAKLREANALDFRKIKAVVLESTGDMSVLHGEDEVDERLLKCVENEN